MVWALDLDDFNNVCGQGKYPLMKTIQSVLGPADTGSPGMMVVQTQRPPQSVPHHPNRQPVPPHHVPPQPQLPPVIDFPVHVSPIGAGIFFSFLIFLRTVCSCNRSKYI